MHPGSSLFYVSRSDADTPRGLSWSFRFLLLVLLALGGVAAVTVALDHPFLIMSYSRALYVDEGFYSDGAQNLVKTGQWALPFDFPHWVGTPFLTLLQSLVFPLFGASLESARMLSIALSLVTALAFYSLARMSMPPVQAMVLTVTSVLSFNYAAHARTALADPTAVCVGMLALWTYARIRPTSLAIPLSFAFALAAAFTKMYYLFGLAAIGALWVVELLAAPALTGRPVDRRALAVLGFSITGTAAVFSGFLYLFADSFAERYAVGAGKLPFMDPAYLRNRLIVSLSELPFSTKAHVYLAVIPACAVAALIALQFPQPRAVLCSRIRRLTRAEVAVGAWLVAGLALVGTLSIIKPHYQFFAILPLCFVGAASLRLVAPARLRSVLVCGAALLHLIFQWPYYEEWLQRPGKTTVLDASREAARLIHERSNASVIPVIGEYSAQLGLFSPRVIGLDAKWAPVYPLCERVAYWKPRFHVNVVWPGSPSQRETDWIRQCHGIDDIEEIARFVIFEPRNDELVVNAIEYRDSP